MPTFITYTFAHLTPVTPGHRVRDARVCVLFDLNIMSEQRQTHAIA